MGARIHRNNAERRCLAVLDNGLCLAEQTLVHCFQICPAVCDVNEGMLRILASFLGRMLTAKHLTSLDSFTETNENLGFISMIESLYWIRF